MKRWICIAVLTEAFILGCDGSLDRPIIPHEKLQNIEMFNPEPYRSPEQPQEPNVLEQAKVSPQKVYLNLAETRAMALRNNLELKVQLYAPGIAEESYNAERAKFESAFFTNVNFGKTDQPVATLLDIQGSQFESARTNLGVEMPLQTGGTLTFELADSRFKTDSQFSIFNPSYESDFSMSISQPLLRGAGLEANRYSIRIAQYDLAIADAQTRLEVISVIAAADRVYWRLYAAYKQLDVRIQQYELARVQLERARRFVRAGQNALIEVTRAEAGLASSLESIIIAENNLRDRQRELKLAIQETGLEAAGTTAIMPTTEPNPVHYTFDSPELVKKAIDNRMEMLELELRLAQADKTLYYLRNQALPLVNLQYTYNVNGLGPTRSDAYDLLGERNFEDQMLGVQVLVPLGNEAAKSRVREAFLQRRQALASKENRQALVEIEVLNALDQLETNWQRILAARQSALLEERLYQAEIRQFEIGMRTSTDVLEAQSNFANAQSTEINALTEYQISLVDLAYATGTLLGSADVEWAPIK
ncbi:MAG: TolC family protein [Planctomycetaceae bacterium]|nr:TolC family protein [Planctomycetaceae bacterium]